MSPPEGSLPYGDQSGPSQDPWSLVAQELFERDADPADGPAPPRWAHLGTEADKAAAREVRHAALPAASPVEHMPVALPAESYTPAQALERRKVIVHQLQEERREVRRCERQVGSFQEFACLRP